MSFTQHQKTALLWAIINQRNDFLKIDPLKYPGGYTNSQGRSLDIDFLNTFLILDDGTPEEIKLIFEKETRLDDKCKKDGDQYYDCFLNICIEVARDEDENFPINIKDFFETIKVSPKNKNAYNVKTDQKYSSNPVLNFFIEDKSHNRLTIDDITALYEKDKLSFGKRITFKNKKDKEKLINSSTQEKFKELEELINLLPIDDKIKAVEELSKSIKAQLKKPKPSNK